MLRVNVYFDHDRFFVLAVAASGGGQGVRTIAYLWLTFEEPAAVLEESE